MFALQWHGLSREEQAKYYERARVERQKHMQMYPHWNARDNYRFGAKKKKLRSKRDKPPPPPPPPPPPHPPQSSTTSRISVASTTSASLEHPTNPISASLNATTTTSPSPFHTSSISGSLSGASGQDQTPNNLKSEKYQDNS